MIDLDGAFYQKDGSGNLRSKCIAEVGAIEALREIEFDFDNFLSQY